uniref:Probable multidrug resistance-associated protein lethal(2)03659 n=1 Tax=Dermatophagoides pteronyssinus TaxID=6956 RepID=A0A6P6Y9A0_DERPT|nr:probable multidrug resistance-associated protein lethal(2)03659 [Dermatophagoides pteronyssinus]
MVESYRWWYHRLFSRWIFYFYPSTKSNECPKQDEADCLFREFHSNYNDRSKFIRNNNNRTLLALIKTFGHEIRLPFVLFFLQDCIIKSIQPILIGWIIRHFSSSSSSSNPMWMIIGLCITSLALIVCHHPAMLLALRLSMRMKIIWSSVIFDKCLHLSYQSVYHRNISGIINLLTSQTRRFDEFALLFYHLILVPIQTVIILIIAYGYLGSASLFAFTMFISFALLNSYLSRRFSLKRSAAIVFTDQRLKFLNETFIHLRTLKILALEQPFIRRIFLARRMEILYIHWPLVARSIMLSFSMMSSRVIMYLTFILSLIIFNITDIQEQFSIETLLVSITLFERLRFSLVWTLPQAISSSFDMFNACKQMDQFLAEPNVIDYKHRTLSDHDHNNNKPIVHVRGLTPNINCHFDLKNIEFKIERGQILIIIGPVGSGKSTLLLTLLGELNVQKSNHFNVNGSIAYTGQEAFCFNGTIRENILFGRSYDSNRYQQIIQLTCLDYDFEQMSLNDQTIIDEGGGNLSGGQRIRIELARALYSDSDIYLLDDPFSSLDSHLAKCIFDQCIKKYLRNKIVIMATHQLHFAYDHHNSHNIRVLLLNSEQKQTEFYTKPLIEPLPPFIENDQILDEQHRQQPKSKSKEKHRLKELNISNDSSIIKSTIGFSLWLDIWQYLQRGSSGFGSIHLVVITSIGTQLMLYLCDQWLSQWQSKQITNENFCQIYTAIILIGIIMAIVRSFSFYKLCHQASEIFHNQLVNNIVHCTTTTTTTINNHFDGQILNYFSRDIGILDETLPATLFELNLALSQVMTIIIVILFLSPYMALITLIYMIMLITLLESYVRPFHRIRKSEFAARNAVFNHLTSTINGAITIRAYRVIDYFQQQFLQLTNLHTAELFGQNVSSRIFCLLVDLISLIYIIFVLIAIQSFHYNQQLIGVCLASIFNLIGITQWACKRAIDSDFCINSYRNLLIFDRLKHEDNNIHEVEHEVSKHRKIFKTSKLAIEIKQLSAYYYDTTPALNNINVQVEHGEKIGICGRSGAGKSTLINTLLRLVYFDGQIHINGHCIRDISTFELRRNFLNIIPQSPVLFNGTVRENLCLLLNDNQHHDDHELWQVLDLVGLGCLVRSFEFGIDQPIIDGKTISVGQKQLLCLARILLQNRQTMKPVIIIMDEATAHIDQQTDHQIQQTLRKRFAHCTMLIIAHRLNTIMDCDRIWVFDNGKLIEDGQPQSLLDDDHSHFFRLVNK